MTTIKPPSETTPAAAPEGADRTEEPEGAVEFQALLDAPQAIGGTAEVRGGEDVGQLVDQVRAGTLTVNQAVESLVTRAIDGVGDNLDPAGRVELETLLRQGLESDPILIALRRAAGEQ